jgi:hypothetical protein
LDPPVFGYFYYFVVIRFYLQMIDYGFLRKTNLIRQTYKINGEKAIHLKPRPQPKDARPSTKAKLGASCEACARYLQDVPNRFCSIACKVTKISLIMSTSYYFLLNVFFLKKKPNKIQFVSKMPPLFLQVPCLSQNRRETPLKVISDSIFRFQWSLKIKATISSPSQFRNFLTFPGRKTAVQKGIQVRTNRHFL